MYLMPLWALLSGVRSRKGWALLSSKMLPSGFYGALLPWSSYFWRCQVTRICTPPLGPSSWRRYWIMPSHQIQLPMWSLRRRCWTFVPFLNFGYASGWGGACGGRDDDEDAWSGGGADAELVGRVGGGAGGWEVVAPLSYVAIWGLGACAPLFCRARFGGTGAGGAGGAWDWKKGYLACWRVSRSGGSAAVCMVTSARLRVRLASLRTVSGGSVAHGSAAGLSPKGWWRW